MRKAGVRSGRQEERKVRLASELLAEPPKERLDHSPLFGDGPVRAGVEEREVRQEPEVARVGLIRFQVVLLRRTGSPIPP